jgi:hypothetical protein
MIRDMSGSEGNELTLPALLAARARAASDGRLAADAGAGLMAGTFAAIVRPPAWPLIVAVGACFLAYGAWGIADRALQERPRGARAVWALRGLRAAAAALGSLGVMAMVGIIMGFALGNWIH